MTTDTEPLDIRRRRAAYRAAHRGTKEMDLLMGRFAEARLGGMSEPELGRFEALLALPDPELQRWILDPAASPGPSLDPKAHALGDLILALRRFHGLAPGT